MSNLKIFTENIEQQARDQVDLLLKQSAFKDSKVRIMPDCHQGKGCVIGFTADLGDKIIPNIVGVDISCGMLAVELGNIDLDLVELDKVIRKYVPSGRNVHEGIVSKFDKLQELKCFRELKDTKRLERSIGSLGGGNHFIEVDIDIDDTNNKYLIIHTGSRNLGKQVADYYQNLAYELMQGKDKLIEEQELIIKEYKQQGRRSEIQAAIKELYKSYQTKDIKIPKELCYLEGKYREMYLNDMKICQEYASLNRRTIADLILNKFDIFLENCDLFVFETIHNYIDLETNIVRKGAISAKKDELLLIPINMRDGCILGKGKGNVDWNESAPHGAGRIMSRMEAKRVLNFDEYKESMKDIYTTSVNVDTLDEAPMVYKPMQEIIDNIKDTVEIIKILKPIYNFKASE